MEQSNQHEKIHQVLLEFEQYDKLHHEFLLDFENGIYNFMVDHSDDIKFYKGFSEDLKTFSISLINCAYEVIEKDSNYPDYRMAMELGNMDHLLQRYPSPTEHSDFTEGFSKMAKAKMPKYFPALYQLSADGFRLLERNTSYLINSFLIYLYKPKH